MTLSPECVEADWPQIRSRLAAEKKIAERHGCGASTHIYVDGSVPGGRSENITPASVSGYRSTVDLLLPWRSSLC